jgi:ligand-binding sensor domain-containing protein
MHIFFYRLAFIFFTMGLSSVTILYSQTWMQVPEIPTEYVNSIIDDQGILYAATDSALYKSTDEGDSWHLTPQQPESIHLNTIFSHMGILYIGTRGDGVFRSPDGGDTWEDISTGLAGVARTIAEFTVRGDSLFAGTDGGGVYVLNLHNPVQWLSFNNGLFQYGTTSITTSGSTLVASIGSYVFICSPGAAAWTHVLLSPDSFPIPIKIFLIDQYIFVGTQSGIYRGNAGATGWQKTDITQFPDRDIVTFTSLGNRIFAGLIHSSGHYIFSSDNYGETWDIRAHEFAFLFTMIVSHGRLWAARDDGLWYYDTDVWTSLEDLGTPLPDSFVLEQNYPNPFNPSTKIRFTLPERTVTELKIFNLLGTEIAVLVNDVLDAGIYTVSWDGGGYPSGVYFNRLRTGNNVITRKMILSR